MGSDKNSETDSISSEFENRKVIECTDVSCDEVKKDEKRYKCTFHGCDKAFTRPSRLTRHMRLHTGEKCYKCNHPGCDKAYTNSSHLKRHMETHNPLQKTYQCSECLLFISNQHNLKRHYNLMHRDHEKLTCKKCNLTFTKKYQLATHMIAHTEEVHKCDPCNKSFANFRNYKRHIENHNGRTKTYACTASGCSEVFNKWQQFYAHQKTHNIVYHKCKDCDKVFLKKYRLATHSKIHEQDRVIFPCPYKDCFRIFHFKSNVDTHIRNNHLGRKFQCDICKVEISTKAKLAEHIHKLHMSEKLIRRTKKGQRRKRKDAGIRKNVNLPPKIEEIVLKIEEDIPYIEEFEPTVPDDNSDS